MCLFADVSGFTALSEAMMSSTEGVEGLAKHLNAYFGQMVKIIASEGGDVFKVGRCFDFFGAVASSTQRSGTWKPGGINDNQQIQDLSFGSPLLPLLLLLLRIARLAIEQMSVAGGGLYAPTFAFFDRLPWGSRLLTIAGPRCILCPSDGRFTFVTRALTSPPSNLLWCFSSCRHVSSCCCSFSSSPATR